jgi:hypothetical protein
MKRVDVREAKGCAKKHCDNCWVRQLQVSAAFALEVSG